VDSSKILNEDGNAELMVTIKVTAPKDHDLLIHTTGMQVVRTIEGVGGTMNSSIKFDGTELKGTILTDHDKVPAGTSRLIKVTATIYKGYTGTTGIMVPWINWTFEDKICPRSTTEMFLEQRISSGEIYIPGD
jgi:hypothetical protein